MNCYRLEPCTSSAAANPPYYLARDQGRNQTLGLSAGASPERHRLSKSAGNWHLYRRFLRARQEIGHGIKRKCNILSNVSTKSDELFTLKPGVIGFSVFGTMMSSRISRV